MTWYSTLDLAMQGFITNPCNLLRGTRKPSGLFDKDEDVDLFTSPDDTLDNKTAEDLFKNFGSAGSISDDNLTTLDDPSWAVDNSFGNLDDVFGMDIFTDLSGLISEDSMSVTVKVDEESVPDTVTEVSTSSWLESLGLCKPSVINIIQECTEDSTDRKRKISEASVTSSDLDHGSYYAKRQKVLVEMSDDDDDDEIRRKRGEKYVERRNKNNVASKRSRETRKMKFVNMETEAVSLVSKNEELRNKIAEMEKLANEMKKILVQHMSKK